MKSSLAERYAKALLEAAKKEGVVQEVADDLQALSELNAESLEFQRFVQDPVIPSVDQERAVTAMFDGILRTLTFTFIRMLISKRRLSILADIIDMYQDLHRRIKGVVRAKITSYTDFNEQQLSQLSRQLEAKIGRKVETDVIVDPSVLGGFKVQVGDVVHDFTFQNQIDNFEERLLTG